ncbi:AAA family ATPase [Paenibacillus shunpengii]|uniref:AAA family ATPase n=1 Tax=Paenibacillus shunpengii TaxID=2054424 RepID=A0ABW5SKM7_9BACL|nr:AAA family ATPase [Paenibacillus sp. FSL H7-0326]OMC70857.1 AAA family ATPase [Paenibacillus sp. FSL H7-0326]
MYLKRVLMLHDKIENSEAYPFSIPSIHSMEEIQFRKPVSFFVGENGSGKSTLLEAIAYQCGFHTAGGGRNNLYDVEASESALGDYIRLSWMPKITNGFFLRAESFYQFASHIDSDPEHLPNYGGKSLHHQSHGESFLSLFVHRFGSQRAIYLLDEPEAALSPTRQLSLLRVIYDLREQAQFIIATHSPILLGYPDADIFSFDQTPIRPIAYEDTEHYQVTRRFLENKKQILNELFSDD